MDYELYQKEHEEKHSNAFLLDEHDVAEARQKIILAYYQRIPRLQRQGREQARHCP